MKTKLQKNPHRGSDFNDFLAEEGIRPDVEILALKRVVALELQQILEQEHITKTQLAQEWDMSLDQAIEAEAQAQAICMQTGDFERAYRAFVAREKPVFEGN
jgi:enoyl-CoA hydratase/carnithine racemase